MPSHRGDLFENPMTGERGVVRWGTADSGGTLLVADLFIRPGGAVVGEHTHPNIDEAFTIYSGKVGIRLDGRTSIAAPGQRLEARRGSVHDWWNAGDEEAHVLVEVNPGARFEQMIANLFGLAMDGKTDATGMPSLLQMAMLAREFDDTVRFTRTPRVIQKVLFGLLAPIASARGYVGSDPKYIDRVPERGTPVGPWPLVATPGVDVADGPVRAADTAGSTAPPLAGAPVPLPVLGR